VAKAVRSSLGAITSYQSMSLLLAPYFSRQELSIHFRTTSDFNVVGLSMLCVTFWSLYNNSLCGFFWSPSCCLENTTGVVFLLYKCVDLYRTTSFKKHDVATLLGIDLYSEGNRPTEQKLCSAPTELLSLIAELPVWSGM
jgi:hypothetical protein